MANTKITTAVIKDDAITTAKIADDAVTGALIADDVALAGNPTTTTQSAGNNTTRIATTAFVTTAINNLVDSAPSALDTLNELAAAMGDDANFSTTVTNSIATKLPLAGGTMTGDIAHASDFTLDIGGEFIIDVDTQGSGNGILLKDAGTLYGSIFRSSSHLHIKAEHQDKDLLLMGNDGGSEITALTLDMSEAGKATFNAGAAFGSDITVAGTINISGDGDDLIISSADYENVFIGNRGASGANLDKGYIRLKSEGTNTVVIDTAGDSYFNGGSVGIGTSSISNGSLAVAGVLSLEPGGPVSISASNSRPNLARNADGELRIAAGKDSNGFITFHVTPSGSTNVMERFKMADNVTFTGRAGTSPIFSMVNSDNEDTDTGRETSLRFSGFRSGGESVDSAQISGNHDGSADDDKGGLLFYTNNGSGLNQAMSISSTGRLTTTADIVPGADVIMATGRGISFVNSGTSGASTDTQLLDDFEKGTWTMFFDTTGSGFASSTNSFTGQFVKVGRICTAYAYTGSFNITAAGSGIARIRGFPFNSSSSSSAYAAIQIYHTTALNSDPSGGYLQQGNNFAYPVPNGTVGGTSWKVANGVYLMVQATYVTA